MTKKHIILSILLVLALTSLVLIKNPFKDEIKTINQPTNITKAETDNTASDAENKKDKVKKLLKTVMQDLRQFINNKQDNPKYENEESLSRALAFGYLTREKKDFDIIVETKVSPYDCGHSKFESYIDTMDVPEINKCIDIIESATLETIDQLYQ